MRGGKFLSDSNVRKALLLISAAMFAHVLYSLCTTIGTTGLRWDYQIFWVMSDLLRIGDWAIAYDSSAFSEFVSASFGTQVNQAPLWYPPHAWIFFWPLAYAPISPGFILWTIAGLGLLWLAVRLAFRIRGADAAYCVFSPAAAFNVAVGHFGCFTAALLIGALGVLDRRPYLSGFFLGLLSIKPNLGLLVPVALIAGRLWRTFAAATATTLGLVGLSILLFGLTPWLQYLYSVSPGAVSHISESHTVAIIPTVLRTALALGASDELARALQIAAALWAAIAVYLVWRWQTNANLRSGILLTGIFLSTPYAYSYDMITLALASLLVFREIENDGGMAGERSLLIAVWMLPLLMSFSYHAFGFPLAPFVLVLFSIMLVYRSAVRAGIAGSSLGARV